MTALGRKRSIVSAILRLSAMSVSTSGPHRTAQRCPVLRLSTTTGTQPEAAKALQVWLPMYPAPPVTRIVSDIEFTPHRAGLAPRRISAAEAADFTRQRYATLRPAARPERSRAACAFAPQSSRSSSPALPRDALSEPIPAAHAPA